MARAGGWCSHPGTVLWLSSPPFTVPSPASAFSWKRSPRLPSWFLQGTTTSSWSYLGLERSWRGAAPQPWGSEGCSLYRQAWFGATAPPQCRVALEGCLQMGTSTRRQIFWVEKYPRDATSWSCCFLPKDCNSIYSTFERKWAGKKRTGLGICC